MTFLAAQNDHSLFESELKPEERERKAKQRVTQRKVELMNQREKEKKRNEHT